MLKRFATRAVSRLVLQPLFRQTRGMTLGTRTAMIDSQSRVLLVRHGYMAGWMLPGGGVERGENIQASALRELREEAAVIAGEEPHLHGVFLNDHNFPGDHVACFVLRRFHWETFRPTAEIAEARFFDIVSLPEETTAGTRRRVAEIFDGASISRDW